MTRHLHRIAATRKPLERLSPPHGTELLIYALAPVARPAPCHIPPTAHILCAPACIARSTPVADCQKFIAQTRWIVAIGASGPRGLDDIRELLGELPSKIAAVIMVALHRPWHGPSYLHDILTSATALPV